MERVTSRFGDRVNGTRRVHTVLSGQGAGFHLKFLQGVWKRERQILIAERVVVRAAIQPVGHRAGHAAGDRRRSLRGIRTAERPAFTSAARKKQQIGHLAAIQGQIDHALLVDHLADARVLGLHHRRRGFHQYLFIDCANPERHINGGIAVHLQRDASLYVPAKASLSDLELIRPDGQLRDDITAVGPGSGGTADSSGGLGSLHFRARHSGTGGILDGTFDL